MGKRGGKRGGGRGRGGGGFSHGRGASSGGQGRRDNRTNKADVVRHNVKYEGYYNNLNLVPTEDRETFWHTLRKDLPNSFRFTGSKAHALAVQQRLKDFYIPEITSITYDGDFVEAPQPVPWFPDQLAWFMTTPKNVIRRFAPFASFQKFLVAETDVGNISRQEVVSMIPPLLMDIKPGMTVLDLCAAPGSKSAQLIEMIHAGEEDRTRKIADHVANGLDRPEGEGYEDDGRSTGLLVANDVDYKRAHMLVHQVKRLSSPNILVTNHDATIFPSIKLPSPPSTNGKPAPNRYLKFDRILADVPCSGDGTARKNLDIWNKWTPSNGLGLHATQVRILVRALQMLKVGGRVVYSTCSMSPVEDEAVIAAAIDQCGGSSNVHLLETKDYLPGLKRYAGLREWKIMDKAGRIWNSYNEVVSQKESHGEDGLSRVYEGMFPPKEDLHLERAIRVYAHQQDTGAFFIAILEKKSEIRARSEDQAPLTAIPAAVEVAESSETTNGLDTEPDGEVTSGTADYLDANLEATTGKRKRDIEENAEESDSKKSKMDLIKAESGRRRSEANGTTDGSERKLPDENAQPTNRAPNTDAYKMKKSRDVPFEEPFKYLDPGITEIDRIFDFYGISSRFPRDRFMVRNAQGTATKNIYYTSLLGKQILQENEGKGMKFVHSGIKMFVRQDVPKPDVCPWRIQTDGLPIVEAWVGNQRKITLRKRETLRKLLIEMFPRFAGEDWKNLDEIGEQVRDVDMGCCVLIVESSEDADGLAERMVFPLWKSVQSLNLMLPKEDRKAMLLRLFNDDRPLINPGLNGPKAKAVPRKEPEIQVEPGRTVRKNSSSSIETVPDQTAGAPEDMSEDSEDGGAAITQTEQAENGTR